MKIAMIAAFEKNHGIGKDGKIIWNFPRDKEYYKTITTGHIVIFGRKSYEEFNRPLPDRINIVVSRKKSFEGRNLYSAKSLEEAIERGKKIAAERSENHSFLSPEPLIFICGGEKLYRQGMKLADLIFTTQIEASYSCDRFFPDIDEKNFEEVSRSSKNDNGTRLNFITYRRR